MAIKGDPPAPAVGGKGLQAGALGLVGNVVIGLGAVAPAYSLAVIAPSKFPPRAEAPEEVADEAGAESEAEFCFAPPHAAPNDVIKRSARSEIVRDD